MDSGNYVCSFGNHNNNYNNPNKINLFRFKKNRENTMQEEINEFNKKIGSRIRIARTELGLSQQDLGRYLDITYQQVQKYETGLNRVSACSLAMISRITKKDINYFYERIDNPVSNLIEIENHREFFRLSKAWRKLGKDQRKAIMGLIESITTQEQY
jgi:transcriptional regulator with XRE-family HTH domain